VFTAILNTGIRTRFAQIPGYGTEFTLPQSIEGYAQLHNLPDGPTKDAVLTAFADSLRVSYALSVHGSTSADMQTCWIAAAAMMFAALLITLPTRSYSSNRTGGKTVDDASRIAEVREKAETSEVDDDLAPGGDAVQAGSGSTSAASDGALLPRDKIK
jgi:hypothetical protein